MEYEQPELYQIRIKGHLDQRWADRFDGLTITLEDSGETLLTGLVVDQAALYGLLRKVRDLGMPLISLSRIELKHTTGQRSNPKRQSDHSKIKGEKP